MKALESLLLGEDPLPSNNLRFFRVFLVSGSLVAPDILKNVPHYVPVESFEAISDPIGTVRGYLVSYCWKLCQGVLLYTLSRT